MLLPSPSLRARRSTSVISPHLPGIRLGGNLGPIDECVRASFATVWGIKINGFEMLITFSQSQHRFS